MKILKLWPLVLILASLWLAPELTLVYLALGMIVKLVHTFSQSRENIGDEPLFHSMFGLLVEVYYILTWPRYLKGIGLKLAIKICGGILFAIMLILGLLYYLGTTFTVPAPIIENYKAVLTNSTHPAPQAVKDQAIQRMNGEFTYADLLWARATVRSACPQPEPTLSGVDRFTSTLKIGLYSVEEVYAALVVASEHTSEVFACGVRAEKTENPAKTDSSKQTESTEQTK
jgi:hypothetical protein